MTVLVHKAIEPDKGTKKAKAAYDAALLGLTDYSSALFPKLDGVYVQFVHDGKAWIAYSRTGEEIRSLPAELFAALGAFGQPGRRYIGEIWREDWPHSWINGAARKQSVVLGLQVHLFDSFDERYPDEPFRVRYDALPSASEFGLYVVPPVRRRIRDIDTMFEEAASMQAVGTYDGLILRTWDDKFVPGDGTYGGIWKIKPRPDGDFRIIGVTEGKGNRAGGIGAFIVSLGGDRTCEVGAGLTKAHVAMDPDDVIGRIAKIEYLSVSAKGLLREPSFISFRYDKTVADVLP